MKRISIWLLAGFVFYMLALTLWLSIRGSERAIQSIEFEWQGDSATIVGGNKSVVFDQVFRDTIRFPEDFPQNIDSIILKDMSVVHLYVSHTDGRSPTIIVTGMGYATIECTDHISNMEVIAMDMGIAKINCSADTLIIKASEMSKVKLSGNYDLVTGELEHMAKLVSLKDLKIKTNSIVVLERAKAEVETGK